MNFLYIVILINSLLIFDKPLIKWLTPTTQNAGILPQGQPYTFVFEFVVIGKDSVLIDNIRTDCSCTASDWQADEPPTAPDTRRQLRISYDAHRKGFFEKKISVWLHHQRKPEKLYIRGEVR